MRAFILPLILLISLPLLSLRAAASETLEMLNSYVSLRIHLSHSDGQMVGAAWLRVKNTTGSPLSAVPFVMNPGLMVTKATLGNGSPLSQSSEVTDISGYEYLRATAGSVRLPSPISTGGEAEIVIHFRGTLQAIDWAGIPGAKETLNPDFTIIRGASFGYPVIAEPNKASIDQALTQNAYYQTATIELPSGYSVAGNLVKADRTAGGSTDKIDLKADVPMKAMTLPIGRYTTSTLDGIQFSTLSAGVDVTPLLSAAKPTLSKLTHWLGTPKTDLMVTYVPAGYGMAVDTGFLMLEEGTLDTLAVHQAVTGLWGLNSVTSGAWDTGLKSVLLSLLDGKDAAAESTKAFDAALTYLSADPALSKTPLADVRDPQALDATGKLMFWVLYNQLGEDDFMALARMLRSEIRNSAAGYQMLADVMQEESDQKVAQKIAKNWLEKAGFAKDMKKAKSFSDLAGRY